MVPTRSLLSLVCPSTAPVPPQMWGGGLQWGSAAPTCTCWLSSCTRSCTRRAKTFCRHRPSSACSRGGGSWEQMGGTRGCCGNTMRPPPPPQHLRMHQDPPYDTQDPSQHFKTPQKTQGPPKIAPMTSPCNNMLPDPPTTPRASPVTPQDCPSDHPKPPPIPLYPDHDTQTPPRSPCPPPLYPNCTPCPPRITLSPLLHHTMLPSPHQGTLCPPRVSQLPWGSPCNAGGTPKPPQFSPPGSARAPAGSGCG